MRKASLSALLFLSSLWLAACGGDDGAKPKPSDEADAGDVVQAGDGTGDGASGDLLASCPREDVLPIASFEGDSGWTVADLMACAEACPEGSAADCYPTNCPGVELFDECFIRESLVCLTLPGGACRDQWEGVVCCEAAFCLEAQTQEEYDACFDANCKSYDVAFSACDDANFDSCGPTGVRACVDPDVGGVEDGGVEDGGVEDGGVSPAPAPNLRKRFTSPALRTRARSFSFPSR